MTNEQMKDPDVDSLEVREAGDDLASDQVDPTPLGAKLDLLLKPDHDQKVFPMRRKTRPQRTHRPAEPPALPGPAPDHFDFTTDAWRRRQGAVKGRHEVDSARSEHGWRARLGISPYHRNPAHVLLANPHVIAALIITLALMLRVVDVQRRSFTPPSDARASLALGGQIASSGDYSSVQIGAGGTRLGPTAFVAPAYPYLLGALNLVSGDAATSSSQAHLDRLAQAVLGAVVVALIGLIALEMFGVDMALLAMALAAIYPPMIEMSAVLSSETLLTVFVLAAVLTALRMRDSRDPLRWALATGAFTGLAILTRVGAIVLLIPFGVAATSVVPVVGRRKVAGLVVLASATLLTLTPWLIRDGLVMHRFVPVTDASGLTLAGTYNATSAHAQPAYSWLPYRQVPAYADLAHRAPRLTEAQLSDRLDTRALTYIAHHPSSVLETFWHNTLRLLELDGTAAWHASAQAIGLSNGTAEIGVICFWGLCVLALLGVVAPAGMRAPGWLWGVPVALWLVTVLINAPTPSLRAAIDPFLILLAARGIARLSRWIRPRPAHERRAPAVA